MNKLVAGAVLLALTACGGGRTTMVSGEQTTMGQELLDLKKAFDAGAITEEEYLKAKEMILEGRR